MTPSFRHYQKRPLVFIFAVLLGGCIPFRYDFLYIQIHEESMIVTESGRFPSGDTMLHDHVPMPNKYELRRHSYVLNAGLGQSVNRPAINFSALTNDGDELLISGTFAQECYGVLIPSEGQYELPPPRALQLTFVWVRLSLPECAAAGPQDVGDGEIAFKIFNNQDEPLGEEIIRFSVKKNGYFIEIDSL